MLFERPTKCEICGLSDLADWGGGWITCTHCSWLWSPLSDEPKGKFACQEAFEKQCPDHLRSEIHNKDVWGEYRCDALRFEFGRFRKGWEAARSHYPAEETRVPVKEALFVPVSSYGHVQPIVFTSEDGAWHHLYQSEGRSAPKALCGKYGETLRWIKERGAKVIEVGLISLEPRG